jgi:hypothetical protein
MSDDNMIDEDGNVYEKGWGGEYRPKQGLFGNEQDKDWLGRPNVSQDFLGRPEEEKDFWGNSTTSSDGKKLYRRQNTSNNDNSSSSGGGGLEILFAILALAVALIGVTIAATPIIAPILLSTVEKERKKGNIAYVAKWESWGAIASVVAIFVVLALAGTIGFTIASSIVGLTQNSTSSILTSFLYVIATICGLISFVLAFITGISPTALIYLKNKEEHSLLKGDVTTAIRTKKIHSTIKIAAISTVILTVAISLIAILISIVSGLFTNKSTQNIPSSSETAMPISAIQNTPTNIPVFTQTANSVELASTSTPQNFFTITPESARKYAEISDEIFEVNLRKSPGYKNKNDNIDVVVKIPTGEIVEITGESKSADGLTWWYVIWNGYEGWIADHTGSGKTILVFQ